MEPLYPKKPEPLHTYEAKARSCLMCRARRFVISTSSLRRSSFEAMDKSVERIIRRVLEEAGKRRPAITLGDEYGGANQR